MTNQVVVLIDGKTYAGKLTEVMLEEDPVPKDSVIDEIPAENQEDVIEGDLPQEDIETPDEAVEKVYETEVLYGVNFRSAPDTDTGTLVYRMLTKKEKIHVIEQVDEGWLKVETQDGTVGYVSSNPKYTNYALSSDLDKLADKVVAFGSKFLGVPYVFGAKVGQTDNFDCSSFVKFVWQEVLAVNLQRVSYNQATQGKEVKSKEDLKKGDLMFFSSSSRGLEIGHVGIYAGNDTILHTYSVKSGGVRFDKFSGSQWESRYVTARRFI